MNARAFLTTTALTALFSATAILRPAPVAAHCDSMDGPVVTAARAALARNSVHLVLGWVRAEDEPGIRAAFERTLQVRQGGPEARSLADQWFFETLVRVHREGEGAPYTGLKPAGAEAAEGIATADHALEAGAVDALAEEVAERTAHAVRERFERVRAMAGYDPNDVEAARAYVHAYVEYIHAVEAIVAAVHGGNHS